MLSKNAYCVADRVLAAHPVNYVVNYLIPVMPMGSGSSSYTIRCSNGERQEERPVRCAKSLGSSWALFHLTRIITSKWFQAKCNDNYRILV